MNLTVYLELRTALRPGDCDLMTETAPALKVAAANLWRRKAASSRIPRVATNDKYSWGACCYFAAFFTLGASIAGTSSPSAVARSI
jgi:hypothetical protein